MKQRQRKRVLMSKGHGTRFGKRCRTFEPGCVACEAHRMLDLLGRFPNSSEDLLSFIENSYAEFEKT